MKDLLRKRELRLKWGAFVSGLMLLCGLAGIALPARASPNQDLSIRAHIINAPDAIPDLIAAPVGTVSGDIQLSWTAARNRNRIGMSQYLIRFATYPAVNQSAADAWFTSASSAITVNAVSPPGGMEFYSLSGLSLGTTYYFGIKAVDYDQQISSVDLRVGTTNQAQCMPLDTRAPGAPGNFAGIAISSTAIQWQWDLGFNATSYILYSYPADIPLASTTTLTIVESGLSPNQSATRRVRAQNGFGSSPPTSAQTVYTLAAVPSALSVTALSANSISLAWLSGGNPAGTQYRLERSLDGSLYSNVFGGTQLTFNDTGLIPSTSYYYRVHAVNGDGVSSSPSNIVSSQTLASGDLMPPEAPMGLKGSLDPSGKAFTLLWEPVVRNADGTDIHDLAGYNVYRRTTLTGVGNKLTPVPLGVTVFADEVDNKTFYYTVRAIDTVGNESEDSLIADSSSDANVIFLATDGISSVVMPESINNLLRSAYNKYGVPLTITLREEPIPNDTAIVRNVRLQLVRSDTKGVLTDLAFTQPQSVISIGYNQAGGLVGRGAPLNSAAVGVAATTQATPDRLSIYWNNGVTWVKVGGTLDQAQQALRIKSSFLGNYQLRIAPSATSLTLDQGNVFPRVFTPNGDGFNDRVYFVLENPNATGVSGEIFDMTGRKVVTLPGPANTGVGTTLIWDGKDASGAVVPSGAYIYKIQGEGKTFTGTVAVAR